MSSAKYWIGWVKKSGKEGNRSFASLSEAQAGLRGLKANASVVSGALFDGEGERLEHFWYANIEQRENYGF